MKKSQLKKKEPKHSQLSAFEDIDVIMTNEEHSQPVKENSLKQMISDKDKICEVCFQIVGSPIKDEGYQIVQCQGCNLYAHRRCIGDAVEVKLAKPTKKTQQVTVFDCQRCMNKASEETCQVCNIKVGLMTQVKDEGYIHYICGILSDQYEIEDYSTITFRKSVTVSERLEVNKELECMFCKEGKGYLLKCLKKGCKLAGHAYCIQIHKKSTMELNLQDPDKEVECQGWEVEFRLQDYSTQQNYQHTSDIYKFISEPELFDDLELKSPQKQFQDQLTISSSKSNRSSKVNKGNQLQTTSNKLHSRINLPVRGGKVSIVCETHRSEPKFCICNSQVVDMTTTMIECDFCSMWYHAKCIGIGNKEAKDIDTYACKKCQLWAQQRTQLIIPTLLGQTSNSGLLFNGDQDQFKDWDTWGNEIFPQERYRLKFIDMVLIARIWFMQSTQLQQYKVSQELLKQQLLRAYYIPLNLYSCIQSLNQKVNKAIECEKSSEAQIEQFFKVEAKQVISSDGMRLEENISANKQLCQDIKTLINEIIDKGGVKTLKCYELEAIVENMENTIQLCDAITSDGQKISFEQLEQLKKELIGERNNRNELKPHIEKLYKEGKELIQKYATIMKVNVLGDNTKLSDVLKFQDDKKDVQTCEELLTKMNASRISFSKQVSEIEQQKSQVQAITTGLKDESINFIEWLQQLKAASKLKLKNKVIDEEFKVFKDNLQWISIAEKVLDRVNRKSNTIDELNQLQKLVTNSKSKFASQVQKDCQQIVSKLSDLEQRFAKVENADDLKEIINQEKQLQVKSSKHQEMKLALKVQQWINDELENPIKIQMVNTYSNSINQEQMQTKLEQVKQDVETKLKPLIDKITNNKDSLEQLRKDLESFEMTQKLIESTHMLEICGTDGLVPDYSSLRDWINKIFSLTFGKQKGKSSASKSFTELLKLIKKDDISKLRLGYQDCFEQLSLLAERLKTDFDEMMASGGDEEQVKDKKSVRLDMAKLKKQLEKAKAQKDQTKIKDVQSQIDKANSWYSEFKTYCQLTEGNLKKELKSNPQKILDKATQLIDKKSKLRLEITSNEAKLLERARKWSQLVVDSQKIMSSKTQTDVELDRIYDIQDLLSRVKALDEIDSVKALRNEFAKLDEYHTKLEKCSEYNETDGKLVKTDVVQIKALLEKARKEIKINISTELKELEDQIQQNQEWDNKAKQVLQDPTYANEEMLEMARDLLERIENDTEDDLNLVNKDIIQQVRVWFIKAKFIEQKSKKKDVLDFIFALEKELSKANDFLIETLLEEEKKMLALAKKLQAYVPSKIQVGSAKNKEQKQRTLTLQDVQYVIEKHQDLPFALEKKMIDKFQKQIDKYNDELDKEVIVLYNEKPLIGEYEKILNKLRELQFITPHETMIEKMKKNYDFIIKMTQQYPPLEDKPQKAKNSDEAKPDGEEDNTDTSMEDEAEQKPRFLQDFMKVHKKYFKLKCQCPEGERLIQEYEKARGEFDQAKSEFNAKKIDNNFTFYELGVINEKLINISLDFEDEELMFRQQIWHARVSKLLQEIQNYKCGERVNSEIVRFWLEEGQELEVVSDIKYEKLNEVVEDIDHITRALKMCATMEEVDKINEMENKALIEIGHLVKKARERVKRGDIPKYVKKSNESSKTGSCALDYLRNCRQKMSGLDAKDDIDMAQLNQQAEDDDDMTEDLEDEKDDEGEGEAKKRKRPSGKSSKPKEDNKPKIFGKKPVDKFQKTTLPQIKGKPLGGGVEKKENSGLEAIKKRLKKQKEKNDEKEKQIQEDSSNKVVEDTKEVKKVEPKPKKAPAKKKSKPDEDKKEGEEGEEKTDKVEPVKKPKAVKVAKPKVENKVDTKEEEPNKKGIKGLGGGIKLGGMAKKPSPLKAALAKPKKEVKKQDEGEKMEVDEAGGVEVEKKSQQVENENEEQQDDTADGTDSNPKKDNKPAILKKDPPKTNSLLAKRPAAKAAISTEPKVEKVAKTKTAEAVAAPKKEEPATKKIGGILKKPGGGLAASLAKINK